MLAVAGALFIAHGASAAPTPAATPYGAQVPLNVKIPVELASQLSSGAVNVGDRFGFKTRNDTKLGTLDVPAGTPGHGRVAAVTVATKDEPGHLTLQADSIDLPDGTPIWVNIDDARPLRGHLADKHTRLGFLIFATTYTGNMILDSGTPFTVDTIERRADPAPLVTAAPTPVPTLSASPTGSAPPVPATASPR